MTQVFISYAREDQTLAISLRNDLAKRGLECWLDAYDIKIGDRWEQLMIRQLEQSQHVLFIHSQYSAAKGGAVEKEYNAALRIARTKPADHCFLIILNLDNSLPRTPEAGEYNWLDFSSGYYQCIESIRLLCTSQNQTHHADSRIEQDARYSRIIAALLSRDYSGAQIMAETNAAYLNRDGIQHLLYALACLGDRPVRGLIYRNAMNIHQQLQHALHKGASLALASRTLLALKIDYFQNNHVTDPAPVAQEVYTLAQKHALSGVEYDLFNNINMSAELKSFLCSIRTSIS